MLRQVGVTSDYVLGLTVVLADVSVVELGGPRLKDVAGLALTKLFVGSAGVLGIVTRITLRLLPVQPLCWRLLAHSTARHRQFSTSPAACGHAVEDVTRMGLDRTAEALLVILG